MRIGKPAISVRDGRIRSTAQVEWEENDRAPFEMCVEWDRGPERPPDETSAGIHPFLMASILPAWRRGERRIAVEGALCPRLRDGLEAAQQILSLWFGPHRDPVVLEPSGGFRPSPWRSARAGLFLTGGTDSLSMLRKNRHDFPAAHPASFREAVYVSRLSFAEAIPGERALDLDRRQAAAIEAICRGNELVFCRIETNFRLFDSGELLVAAREQAALLSGVAHALSPRIGSVSLASSHDTKWLYPWGTHPLLDPQYSSTLLELRHEGLGLTRQEKLSAMADWEIAHHHLVVCFEGPLPAGQVNCGRCEKCLRTMTALLLDGSLERFTVFASPDVTAEKVRAIDFGYHSELFDWLWSSYTEPLKRSGRADIARAVEEKLAEARKHRAWIEERDWRGRIRRLDRRYLGGVLLRTSRRIRGMPL